MSLPRANRCWHCGSKRFEWELAARHRRIERIIISNLGIAAIGAIATVVGHSMLHNPEAHHTWACVLLIGGIAIVTLATMIIAALAMNEDESSRTK
jgi:hypothetical protein